MAFSASVREKLFRLYDTQRTPRPCFSSQLICQRHRTSRRGWFCFPQQPEECRALQAPAKGYLHLILGSASKDRTAEAIFQDLCSPQTKSLLSWYAKFALFSVLHYQEFNTQVCSSFHFI